MHWELAEKAIDKEQNHLLLQVKNAVTAFLLMSISALMKKRAIPVKIQEPLNIDEDILQPLTMVVVEGQR